MSNANAVSPLRAMPLIKMTLKAGKVPYLKSSPGIGKSAMTAEIAKEWNLELIDHRISTSAPTDLTGLPEIVNGRSRFNPFDFFPIAGLDEVPKGKNGWLLFLDEFNSGTKAVLAAAYKLVLDRMVGQYKLHPHVAIVCAGNRDTDRAITTSIGTAMQSRLTTYNIELNNDEFINHIMIKQNWDDRVIAYLSSEPNKINDFRPDHSDDTFCCPRTWDSFQQQIKGEQVTRQHLPLAAGTITSGVAADFFTFLEVYQDMPKFDDVLREPNSYPIPTNPQLKWATVSSFSQKVNKKNFVPLATYIGRFDMTFQVLFFRMTLPNNPELRELPEFGPIAVKFAKYMFDAVS
ncbi:ATPase [Rhizobium phage RHph_N38]|uniref:ATPase domain-containing protein n=1 Tax=Rhizobium phage RHph_N38 TaxID=2509750 RepID=A0A7S5R3M8_9CAUD|nr:ATPase [Rhizobium phage RHph_N38]QIG70507.1 ATPase domain-containing protein [Rhizobium phage RHph_N38]